MSNNIMAKITTYKITNHQGDNLSIANYGARLVSWHTDVGDESRNIVLGYKNVDDYMKDPFYLGAIVGPYANRIANAQCKIGDKKVTLIPNEGVNQLHGGDNALANQFWVCNNHSENSVMLECNLKSGFNGYPGNISVTVIYEISQASELSIILHVTTTELTVVGPTAHSYFNLNKDQSTDHNLQIFGEHYTPVNKQGIPVGGLAPVKNTSFDFSTPKKVSLVNNTHQLDHNFVISKLDSTLNLRSFKHASIQSNDKKITLQASSNYPAVQVYTGMHLKEPFVQNQGICLEPQFCPDSPNQSSFPFHLTSPKQPLTTVIHYKLNKV
jgi:aldose 1-epimerase